MLTVVGQEGAQEQPVPMPLLDELVRDGACRMLAAAWGAEVAAHIDQYADVRDENSHRLVDLSVPAWPPGGDADVRDENGHRLVVRSGYRQEREVLTGC